MMYYPARVLAIAICAVVIPTLSAAQTTALTNTSAQPVTLSDSPGQEVILGSVSLGAQRTFSTFNIQAAGTITPAPDPNGVAFQLEFLICDQPECRGDIKSNARILGNSDSDVPTQVLATQSFGISTHNTKPVVLTEIQPRNPDAPLFLALALKTVHSPSTMSFAAKMNLLRVDVLP